MYRTIRRRELRPYVRRLLRHCPRNRATEGTKYRIDRHDGMTFVAVLVNGRPKEWLQVVD